MSPAGRLQVTVDQDISAGTQQDVAISSRHLTIDVRGATDTM